MNTELQKNISYEIYSEITNLLYKEAFYLDNKMYREWLELLDDEILYKMPLRETVEGIGVDTIVKDMAYFEETKKALTTRVNRLYVKSAWVENPATRQRHFITNIMVEPTKYLNEYKVRSYFLFKRSRGSTHTIEEIFGERHDVLKKVNEEWKIMSRIIYPDQTVITAMNMSMFL